jgi:hypothetical protein
LTFNRLGKNILRIVLGFLLLSMLCFSLPAFSWGGGPDMLLEFIAKLSFEMFPLEASNSQRFKPAASFGDGGFNSDFNLDLLPLLSKEASNTGTDSAVDKSDLTLTTSSDIINNTTTPGSTTGSDIFRGVAGKSVGSQDQTTLNSSDILDGGNGADGSTTGSDILRGAAGKPVGSQDQTTLNSSDILDGGNGAERPVPVLINSGGTISPIMASNIGTDSVVNYSNSKFRGTEKKSNVFASGGKISIVANGACGWTEGEYNYYPDMETTGNLKLPVADGEDLVKGDVPLSVSGKENVGGIPDVIWVVNDTPAQTQQYVETSYTGFLTPAGALGNMLITGWDFLNAAQKSKDAGNLEVTDTEASQTISDFEWARQIDRHLFNAVTDTAAFSNIED